MVEVPKISTDDQARPTLADQLGVKGVEELLAELAAVVGKAMSVDEFCERNRMARSTYHDMQSRDIGPAEMRDGRYVRISPEAELRWRRMMENPTPKQAAAIEDSRVKLRQRAREAAKASVASERHISKRRA